jgi:hypothetical protein
MILATHGAAKIIKETARIAVALRVIFENRFTIFMVLFSSFMSMISGTM